MLVNFTHSMFFPFHKAVYNSKYVKSFVLTTWLYLISILSYQIDPLIGLTFSLVSSVLLYYIINETSDVSRYKNENLNSFSSNLKYVYWAILCTPFFIPFIVKKDKVKNIVKIQIFVKKLFFFLFLIYTIRNLLYLLNKKKLLINDTGTFYLQHSILLLSIILVCTLAVGYFFDMFNIFNLNKKSTTTFNRIIILSLEIIFYIFFFFFFNFRLYKYLLGNNITLFPLIYKYNNNSMYNYTSYPFIIFIGLYLYYFTNLILDYVS